MIASRHKTNAGALLLGRADAAELIGCSTATLDRLTRSGKLSPVSLRRRRLFRRRDIESFVAALS